MKIKQKYDQQFDHALKLNEERQTRALAVNQRKQTAYTDLSLMIHVNKFLKRFDQINKILKTN